MNDNAELVIYESNSKIVLDLKNPENNPPRNIYNSYGQVLIDLNGDCYTYNSDGTICGINIEDNDNMPNDNMPDDYKKVIYTYDSNGNATHIVTTNKNNKVLEDITYTYTYFEDSSNISSSI